MKPLMWLFLSILLSAALSAAPQTFDEVLEEAEFKRLMLSSNGMLMVIEGFLVDENQAPVADKRVSIICDHDGRERTIFTIKTDEHGHFFASQLNMPRWRCDVGDVVWGEFVASPKKQTVKFFVQEAVQKNVPYNTIKPVPEFSTATLAIAIIGVTLGVVVLRKRQH